VSSRTFTYAADGWPNSRGGGGGGTISFLIVSKHSAEKTATFEKERNTPSGNVLGTNSIYIYICTCVRSTRRRPSFAGYVIERIGRATSDLVGLSSTRSNIHRRNATEIAYRPDGYRKPLSRVRETLYSAKGGGAPRIRTRQTAKTERVNYSRFPHARYYNRDDGVLIQTRRGCSYLCVCVDEFRSVAIIVAV